MLNTQSNADSRILSIVYFFYILKRYVIYKQKDEEKGPYLSRKRFIYNKDVSPLKIRPYYK